MTRDRNQSQDLAEPDEEQPGLTDRIRLFGGLGGALLLLLFLVQNLQKSEIRFLWFSWDMPTIFALIASAVLGALGWGVVGFFRRRAADAQLRAQIEADRARGKK
jgi:uncharacterized integral membrane protein